MEGDVMAKHSCYECKWCSSLFDSNHSVIDICVFAQSENYLQEVLLGTEDCELDGYAEELWQRDHDVG
jgi:hypothetical protein